MAVPAAMLDLRGNSEVPPPPPISLLLFLPHKVLHANSFPDQDFHHDFYSFLTLNIYLIIAPVGW